MIRWMLGIGVGVVVIAAALAPWFESQRSPRAASLLYLAFSWACHQLPERTLWIFGAPMALCARCFAICVGALVGLLAAPLLTKRPSLYYLPLAVAPTVLDFLLGKLGVIGNHPGVRVATGALAGAAIMLYLGAWLGRRPS
jgi:uncharacterized membrane protein